MKTSELINKLVDSLTYHGDLPTNINFMGWYCPSEGGSFKAVHLIATDDREVEILEDEFIDIKEIKIDENGYIKFEDGIWKGRKMDVSLSNKIDDLIKNQKEIIKRIKDSE